MAYYDGELGTAAGKKVAKHLETCVECSGLLAAFEKADYATDSAGVSGPDSSYWETFTGRVMKRVKDESLARRHEPEQAPARSRFSPVRFAPAVSVALVVVVAAGVLMKIRHPATPERVVYREDAVVGKGVSQAPEEKALTDVEVGEVTDHSMPEEMIPEPVPARQIDQMAVRKTAPATYADSVKKEAAADEREQLDTVEEETGTMFAEKDDLMVTAPPPATSLESARSSLAVPSQAPATESEGFVKMAEPLSTAEAIDDGSWGQLAFARRLEEEGRHLESEKVLDDLLARNPAVPVQEEASILLVSVLTNQNRMPEARQVLENAQRQYPANMMIQNYRIKNSDQ